MNKKFIIITLIILLLLSVTFLCFEKYKTFNAKKEQELLNSGYEQGINYCVSQILYTISNDLQTKGYTQIGLVFGNETRTVTLVPYEEKKEI